MPIGIRRAGIARARKVNFGNELGIKMSGLGLGISSTIKGRRRSSSAMNIRSKVDNGNENIILGDNNGELEVIFEESLLKITWITELTDINESDTLHRPKNKSFMIPYLATQIHTSLHNNIQERFCQHFLRFINKTTTHLECDKPTLFQFKKQLFQMEETNELFDEWKQTHLQDILPKEIKKSIHYDVKVKPFEYLKGMLYMNSILEKEGHKLFQPLPLRNNIIPKHVILDTACIVDYFTPKVDSQGNKIKKGELFNAIKENQYEIWDNLLNLQDKILKNKHYQFHYQIQTDGFSCCLLFIRKDLKDKKWGSKLPVVNEDEFYNIEDLAKETLDTLKHKTIIGCDPGKHSLVYMMDEKQNKLQYTASQRKVESYGKRNQRILLQEKKRNKIIEKETELSLQNVFG
jgi:hypothetical protein